MTSSPTPTSGGSSSANASTCEALFLAIPLLDRYLWRHVRDIFLFGVAVFTVLLLINHLFFLARLVLQQGAPFLIAVQLLAYRMPYFLAFSFPMAMLLAALMTVGRLSDAQGVTAMRTGGGRPDPTHP